MMEKEHATRLAEAIAVACMRNIFLEDLHAGVSPSSLAGDLSDEGGDSAWENPPGGRVACKIRQHY